MVGDAGWGLRARHGASYPSRHPLCCSWVPCEPVPAPNISGRCQLLIQKALGCRCLAVLFCPRSWGSSCHCFSLKVSLPSACLQVDFITAFEHKSLRGGNKKPTHPNRHPRSGSAPEPLLTGAGQLCKGAAAVQCRLGEFCLCRVKMYILWFECEVCCSRSMWPLWRKNL